MIENLDFVRLLVVYHDSEDKQRTQTRQLQDPTPFALGEFL